MLLVAIVGMFGALLGRVAYLQLRAPAYLSLTKKERSRPVPFDATRGSILARDNSLLSETTTHSTLICDTTQVKSGPDTAREVSTITGIPYEEALADVRPDLPGRRCPRNVTVCADLSPAAIGTLHQRMDRRGGDKLLTGLSLRNFPVRTYPLGRDCAHAVGFATPIEKPRAGGGPDWKKTYIGRMGIEQGLDSVLAGKDGFTVADRDIRQRKIPHTEHLVQRGSNGLNVRLTIDPMAQHIAAAELERCCERYHPINGTVIVMDPQTGDILALASWPSFDPATRQGLEHKEAYTNYALRLYEPGSTMKALAVAGALSMGIISPSTVLECGGELQVNDRTIRCQSHGSSGTVGHGAVTPGDILTVSCNVGAARIGLMTGYPRLRKWLSDLGFFTRTGVGLPGDCRGRDGFGSTNERDQRGKVARVAFGQSISVTPLAMTAAYAAIANGGTLMQPRLVQDYQDGQGRIVQAFAPHTVRRVLTPELAGQLRGMLRRVVTEGTGKGTQIPGYTSAGKTGTAQKVHQGVKGYARDAHIASFIGFVPAEKPRAVITVVLDEPHGAYYGAEVAGPAFQHVASQLMYYWNVPPDDPASLNVRRRSTVRRQGPMD